MMEVQNCKSCGKPIHFSEYKQYEGKCYQCQPGYGGHSYTEQYTLGPDEGTIVFNKPTDKPRPALLYMAGNGMVVCSDKAGQQIGELQKSFIQLWTEHAVRMGYDPMDLKEIELPHCRVKLIKLEDGTFNWQHI
jgi:hypothetical protein